MARFLVRRLALMALTLWMVSVMVFALADVVPGDAGRTILGPYATPTQVARLDHQMGEDRPAPVRYLRWVGSFATGNWGQSFLLQEPILPLVAGRLVNSALLAGVALVLIIPSSIGLGVLAAVKRDRLTDRIISVAGLSLTAIPEFVSGAILLIVFAVFLHLFPASAEIPPGATPFEVVYHLLLPAVPLMFVLFGYIARMARAGTVEALESNYVRTAVLKGLPPRVVIFKHVLRNALLPTITVVGVQVGWLVGGLVVIETLFNYPGLGKLMLDSAIGHDLPVLEATVLLVALVYMVSNLLNDVLLGLLNPRIRYAAG